MSQSPTNPSSPKSNKFEVNRFVTTPFLVRIFIGDTHLPDAAYANPLELPQNKGCISFHTWLDCTLHELTGLLETAYPGIRKDIKCIVSYALVYPDKKGKMVVKQCGIVKTDPLFWKSNPKKNKNNKMRKNISNDNSDGSIVDKNNNNSKDSDSENDTNDDRTKTLKDLKFEIGDYLDVSVKWDETPPMRDTMDDSRHSMNIRRKNRYFFNNYNNNSNNSNNNNDPSGYRNARPNIHGNRHVMRRSGSNFNRNMNADTRDTRGMRDMRDMRYSKFNRDMRDMRDNRENRDSRPFDRDGHRDGRDRRNSNGARIMRGRGPRYGSGGMPGGQREKFNRDRDGERYRDRNERDRDLRSRDRGDRDRNDRERERESRDSGHGYSNHRKQIHRPVGRRDRPY